MRCKKIRVKGLKGAGEVSLDLSPVTVVKGPNASGKSRLLDALSLLVLGYRPGWNRDADGVLSAASGDTVDVEGVFTRPDDGDVTVSRTWTRERFVRGEKKGEVKEVSRSPRISTVEGSARTTTQEAGIRHFFGLDEEKTLRAEQEMVLDVPSFLALSADARRAALFRLAAVRLEKRWTFSTLRESLPEARRGLLGEPRDKEGPIAFLERAWTAVDEEARTAEAKRRDAEAAARGVEEQSAERTGEEPSAREIAETKAALLACETAAREDGERHAAAVQASKDLLRSARKAEEDALAAKGHKSGKIARLAKDLVALRSASAATGRVAELRVQIAVRETEFGPQSVPLLKEAMEQAERAANAAPDDALKAEAEKIDAVVESARVAFETARELALQTTLPQDSDEPSADDRLSVARAKVADLDNALRWARDARAALPDNPFDEPPVEACCPTCLRAVEESTVPALEAAIGVAKAELKVAADVAAGVAAERQRLAAAAAAAETAADEARGARARFVLRQEKRQREASQAVTIARQAWAPADAELRGLREELRSLEAGKPDDGRIALLERQIAEAEAEPLLGAPDVDAAVRALAEAEMTAMVNVLEWEPKIAAAKELAETAAAAATEKAMRLDLKARALEAEEAAKEARAKADALGPRGLLGKVAADVVGPLSEAVNAFLAGANLGFFVVRAFDERGRPALDLGIESSGAPFFRPGAPFRPVETLSGGEQVLVHAGIGLGLAAVSALPWRPILVDGIEGLDAARQPALFAAVAEAVRSGRADQALLLGCWCEDVAPFPSLSVVTMDGRTP